MGEKAATPVRSGGNHATRWTALRTQRCDIHQYVDRFAPTTLPPPAQMRSDKDLVSANDPRVLAFCSDLEELKQYIVLNHTALLKIMKKVDKKTDTPMRYAHITRNRTRPDFACSRLSASCGAKFHGLLYFLTHRMPNYYSASQTGLVWRRRTLTARPKSVSADPMESATWRRMRRPPYRMCTRAAALLPLICSHLLALIQICASAVS